MTHLKSTQSFVHWLWSHLWVLFPVWKGRHHLRSKNVFQEFSWNLILECLTVDWLIAFQLIFRIKYLSIWLYLTCGLSFLNQSLQVTWISGLSFAKAHRFPRLSNQCVQCQSWFSPLVLRPYSKSWKIPLLVAQSSIDCWLPSEL